MDELSVLERNRIERAVVLAESGRGGRVALDAGDARRLLDLAVDRVSEERVKQVWANLQAVEDELRGRSFELARVVREIEADKKAWEENKLIRVAATGLVILNGLPDDL